jgi:hypothetical protein
MNKWLLFLGFIFIFSSRLTGQHLLPSAATSDSLKNIQIYEQAYRTAGKDKEIKKDERILLDNLAKSLNLTQNELQDIHDRLKEFSQNTLNQSGRWPLMIQNIGWGVDKTKWYVASELLSFTAALYLTHKYTKNMDIPLSRSQMLHLGSGLGYHYGYYLNKAMKIDFDSDRRSWAGVVMASVPVGLWVSDHLYQKWQPTHGQAWALSLSAIMSATAITNIHCLIDNIPEEPLEDINEDFSEHPDYRETKAYKKYDKNLEKWEQVQAFMVMAAYPAGLYLGNKIFGQKDYTVGDALMLYQGYGFGMLYGLMASDIIYGGNFNSGDALFQLALLGGGFSGVWLYDHMETGYDYSFGESMIMAASTIACGITGTILTRKILTPESEARFHTKDTAIKLSLLPEIKFLTPKTTGFRGAAVGVNLQLLF